MCVKLVSVTLGERSRRVVCVCLALLPFPPVCVISLVWDRQAHLSFYTSKSSLKFLITTSSQSLKSLGPVLHLDLMCALTTEHLAVF